jgi:hypothetical protein
VGGTSGCRSIVKDADAAASRDRTGSARSGESSRHRVLDEVVRGELLLEAEIGTDAVVAEVVVEVALCSRQMDQIAPEREHGPVPTETLDWAAQLVEDWDRRRKPPRRRVG